MRRKVWSAVLTVLCVGLTATAWASPSNLVTNGGFEDPTVQNTNLGFDTYTVGQDFGGWHVSSGSVDLIGSYWTPSEGSQSLDLNGTGPGTIAQQSIATTPGASYLLLFDMAGNPVQGPPIKNMRVWWGTQSFDFSFDTRGYSTTSMGWKTYWVLLKATGFTTDLSFQSTTADSPYCGPALDNVQLYAVPEGPSGLLLLPGLLPIAVLVRRRRS
jgi:choice-of-anchor C domain-containing protein